MESQKSKQEQIFSITTKLISDKCFNPILKEFNKLQRKQHMSRICQSLIKRLSKCYNQILNIVEIVLNYQKSNVKRYISEKYEINQEIMKKIRQMAEQSKKYKKLQTIINDFYEDKTQMNSYTAEYFQVQFYQKIVQISKKLERYNKESWKSKYQDPRQYHTHFAKEGTSQYIQLPKNHQQNSSNQQIKSQKGYKFANKVQQNSLKATDLPSKANSSDLTKTNNSAKTIENYNQQLIQILKKSQLHSSQTHDIKNIDQNLQIVRKIIVQSNKLKKNIENKLTLEKEKDYKEKQYKKLQSKLEDLNDQMLIEYKDVTGNNFHFLNASDYFKLYMEQILSTKQKQQEKIPNRKNQKQYESSIEECYMLSSLLDKSELKSMNQQLLDIIKKVHTASLILNDNVINLQRHEKQFIITVIEKTQNKHIQKSKILRSYDVKNTVNPHEYIDKHSNLLVVIRLENDQVIAIYSQNPIFSQEEFTQSMNQKKNNKNILMNVTRNKHFYEKQNIGTRKYQKYRKNQIMFANGDIELNFTDGVVKSKFGTLESSFEDKGMGPNGLIEFEPPQINSIKWKSWEFFQIFFNTGAVYNQQLNQKYLKSIKNALLQQEDKQCQTQLQEKEQQAAYIQLKPNIKFKKYRDRKVLLSFHKVIEIMHGPNLAQIQEKTEYHSQILDLEDQRQQQISKLKQQIESLRKQLDQIHQKCDILQCQKYNTQKKFQYEKKRMEEQLSIKHPSQNQLKLFNGKIFYDDRHQEQKQYLIKLLEKREKKKIKGTYFVYQYDEINLNNFHIYIDGVPNLLLIIRTTSGNIIGGYTKQGIREKKISYNGFIYTAAKQTHFEVDPQKAGIVAVHQPYFLIFGNSELRIKTQDKVIFSNFGILNCYFDTRNRKVDFFLGENGSRTATIDTFQFYRIDFE